MKKILIRIAIGVAALLVITIAVSAYSLGNIVKNRVETVGSNVAQVDVRLGSADVWIFPGRAQIKYLTIGNPPGWKTKVAMQVDDITVRIKTTSAFSAKPIIDSIVIKSPEITFEGSLRDNNLSQIRKNVDNYMGAPENSMPPVDEPSAPKATASRKFQLNSLLITGARLHIPNLFSSGQSVTLPLPDIHLVNLGAGADGITSPEVAQKTLTAVLNVIAENASDVIGKLSKDTMSKAKKFNFEKAAEKLRSFLRQ